METIKSLAPTIFDALNAVEQGCRNLQADAHFQPDMRYWVAITGNICYGCLATATLMQLTNKSGKEIAQSITVNPYDNEAIAEDRAAAYGIEFESCSNASTKMCQFESAIDFLRVKDLSRLLDFYGLGDHKNTEEAMDWLFNEQPIVLGKNITKADLLLYADFVRDIFIPKMKSLFSPAN